MNGMLFNNDIYTELEYIIGKDILYFRSAYLGSLIYIEIRSDLNNPSCEFHMGSDIHRLLQQQAIKSPHIVVKNSI